MRRIKHLLFFVFFFPHGKQKQLTEEHTSLSWRRPSPENWAAFPQLIDVWLPVCMIMSEAALLMQQQQHGNWVTAWSCLKSQRLCSSLRHSNVAKRAKGHTHAKPIYPSVDSKLSKYYLKTSGTQWGFTVCQHLQIICWSGRPLSYQWFSK